MSLAIGVREDFAARSCTADVERWRELRYKDNSYAGPFTGAQERSGTLMATRVLVTGHGGYIGSVIVPLLLESGYDVVGLDSQFYGECSARTLP